MSGTETRLYGQAAPAAKITERRRRKLAVVADGDRSFTVPREALEDWVYPLFGIQYEVHYVPRKSSLRHLKPWLARRYGTMPWSHLWREAVASVNGWFHQYTCLLLPKPSLHLPAGSLIFETIQDFSVIPSDQLAHLTRRTRDRIHQSYAQAVEQFPDRHFYYMEPVYTGAGEKLRLATRDDVRGQIARRYRQLQRFCRRWSWYIRAKDTVDETFKQWEEEARQRRAKRQLTTLLENTPIRNRRTQHALQRARQKDDKTSVKEIAEMAALVRWAQTEQLLDTIDPIITVEEPEWLVDGGSAGVVAHRLVVHWDENKLKVLDV